MKQKGFAPVLIILVIAILGVVGYFAYQNYLAPKGTALGPYTPPQTATTDPTASWKTYTNTKYGYEFKYPQNLSLKSIPIGNSQNADATTSNYIILGQEMYFTVSIGETMTPAQRGYTETQTIGSISFAKMSFPNGEGPNSVPFTRLEADSGAIAIEIEVRGNYPINQEQTQILSTFKFLDSTSKGVIKDQAVQLVKALPEVKDYLKIVPNAIIEFDHESEDKTLWVVHVFEIKDDHTATFNWFDVNEVSGEINKEF